MMNLTTVLTGMASVMNNTEPMGDRLSYGLQMTATGMLVVFAVLGIIFLVMLLSRAVFHREAKKPASPAPVAAPVPQAQAAPAPAAPASDDALIAVLTAAVAAVLADEAAAQGTAVPAFRVVSFQRSSRGRTWNGRR